MKNRIEWIDTAKGIGIIFIVVLHIWIESDITVGLELYRKITNFVLPMFFILSGFVAKPIKTDKWEFFRKTVCRYLVPVYIFGIGFTLIREIYYHISLNIHIFSFFFIKGKTFETVGPAWFIFALFFAVIIFRFSNLDKAKSSIKFCIMISLFAISYSIPYLIDAFGNYARLFGLYRIPVCLAFYLLGNLFREYYSVFRKIPNRKKIAGIMFPFAFLMWILCDIVFNTHISIYAGNLGRYCLYIPGALFGTYCCIYLSYLLSGNRFLNEYGKNTFFTLCTHKFFLWNWIRYISVNFGGIWYVISLVLCFAAILFYANPLCRYLEKHCPVLLGKPIIQNKK